ncbi:MAG: YraN family protein [Rickettsiales bacterium]|nr:YraN family protein [Rickettsiales bacterium]
MVKKRTYQFGILAEKIAIFLLILKGYQILKWRYKTRFGEIDIVAKKSDVIVAVEVKARSSKFLIEEVLHPHQINRIQMAAQFFISKNLKFQNCDLRFDFIEINKFFIPKHHKNFIS